MCRGSQVTFISIYSNGTGRHGINSYGQLSIWTFTRSSDDPSVICFAAKLRQHIAPGFIAPGGQAAWWRGIMETFSGYDLCFTGTSSRGGSRMRDAMTDLIPIYTKDNCRFSAPLQWSFSIFWTEPELNSEWEPRLAADLEQDGIRLLSHRFADPLTSQLAISTLPLWPP